MAQPEQTYVSEADYLIFDAEHDFKSEYANGKIVVMSGANEVHNDISLDTATELNIQLRGRSCKVYHADMRVQVKAWGAYRYPDVVVVCGERQFVEDVSPDTLMNPTVLLEVLSESTKHTDYIQKLNEYRQLPSLQEYVIISQEEARVERYLRQDAQNWLYTVIEGDNTLELPSIGCILSLREIYRKVTFSDTGET